MPRDSIYHAPSRPHYLTFQERNARIPKPRVADPTATGPHPVTALAATNPKIREWHDHLKSYGITPWENITTSLRPSAPPLPSSIPVTSPGELATQYPGGFSSIEDWVASSEHYMSPHSRGAPPPTKPQPLDQDHGSTESNHEERSEGLGSRISELGDSLTDTPAEPQTASPTTSSDSKGRNEPYTPPKQATKPVHGYTLSTDAQHYVLPCDHCGLIRLTSRQSYQATQPVCQCYDWAHQYAQLMANGFIPYDGLPLVAAGNGGYMYNTPHPGPNYYSPPRR